MADSVADGGGHVGNFPAAGFAWVNLAAEILEGFHEERLDAMRLQAMSLGSFHVLADFGYAGSGQGGAGECAAVEQMVHVPCVDDVVYLSEQRRPLAGVIAVANGVG